MLAAALFAGLPSLARAQVAASVSVVSEYWLRAFPVSGGKPVAGLNLSYDHKSGFYAGGSALAEDTAGGGVKMLGFMEYAGYARRVGRRLTLDGGVFNTDLERYAPGRKIPLKYTEAYLGASWRGLTARAYYSPNYLRDHVSTAYLDLSGAVRPRDRWRLFAHGGVLLPVNDLARASVRRRYDLRAGVAREFSRAEVSLTWTYTGPPTVRPGAPQPDRGAVLLGGSYFF